MHPRQDQKRGTKERERAGNPLLAVVSPPGARALKPTSRKRTGLPTKDEVDVRRLVRWLSESGFAIREERHAEIEGGRRVTAVVAGRDPFVIRSYREGDEDAILRLFPECFHVRRELDHWRWKYTGNPYGARPRQGVKISMAFSPQGELAAHYASYPTPIWRGDRRGGNTTLALQMGDTMTSPAYRGVGRGRGGLLPRTVRHFFSIHRDGGYGFYYGFNTGPIQRFCVWFIGGSKIGPVEYWTRDLTASTPRGAGRYRIERVRQVDAEWDRFFERVAPRYRFLVQRDARYVDWRYLRCPDVEYVVLAARRWGRLVGWCVFRRREDCLVWGDALFDPRHARAAESILASAAREPVLAGAGRLAAWFSSGLGWWCKQLDALGMSSGPEPDGLGMVALADGDEDAIDKLGELYYTMGDGDLF